MSPTTSPNGRRGPLMTGGTPLSSLAEEGLLARILPLFPSGDVVVVGPGDDAAVLRTGSRVVATTDTVVLGRDWVDAWSSGADIGHKVVVQNLADVAAMGGRATGVLLTLVAGPELAVEWMLDHAEGVAQACAEAGVAVLGGDLSSAPAGIVVVSVTALGAIEGEPVLRSGARPGDQLAVCGTLGLAAAGLVLLAEGRQDAHPIAVARQRRPESPLRAGPEAARAGATAMLDISDGLLRDGGRIAGASGVVVDVESPRSARDVEGLVPALGAEAARECVLTGGEEHSLLATFPPGDLPGSGAASASVRAVGPGRTGGGPRSTARPRCTPAGTTSGPTDDATRPD